MRPPGVAVSSSKWPNATQVTVQLTVSFSIGRLLTWLSRSHLAAQSVANVADVVPRCRRTDEGVRVAGEAVVVGRHAVGGAALRVGQPALVRSGRRQRLWTMDRPTAVYTGTHTTVHTTVHTTECRHKYGDTFSEHRFVPYLEAKHWLGKWTLTAGTWTEWESQWEEWHQVTGG